MKQLPKFHETFIPILDITKDQSEMFHKDIKNKVKEKFYSDLPSELLTQTIKNGENTLFNRIHWAISYLTMGGYLQRTRRGHFKITEKGLQTQTQKQQSQEPLRLVEVTQQPEYIITHPQNRNQENNEDTETIEKTPEELIDSGIEGINAEVKTQLLEKIKTMDPYEFEYLVLKLFKAMGYGDTKETPKSHDGGIDGIIYLDKLGLEKIYIQAKRFNDEPVGEPKIRNFIGAMSSDANKGIFVTTSTFQQKAKEKATSASQTIKLIDGEELADLMFEYGIGVQTKNNIEIKEIDEDFFEN